MRINVGKWLDDRTQEQFTILRHTVTLSASHQTTHHTTQKVMVSTQREYMQIISHAYVDITVSSTFMHFDRVKIPN